MGRNGMKKLLFVLTFVFGISAVAFAQSPAGKWAGEMPGGRGGTTPVAFEFMAPGADGAVTGTITINNGMPTAITGGKFAGGTLTFQAPAGGGGGRGGGGGGGGRGAGGGGGG